MRKDERMSGACIERMSWHDVNGCNVMRCWSRDWPNIQYMGHSS